MCLASGVGIRVFYGAATGSGDGFSGRNEDQNELLNCRKLKYIVRLQVLDIRWQGIP